MVFTCQEIGKVSFHSWIECDWENELLIINEDIHHIEKEPIIIFFEILDILSDFQNEKQIGNEAVEELKCCFEENLYFE